MVIKPEPEVTTLGALTEENAECGGDEWSDDWLRSDRNSDAWPRLSRCRVEVGMGMLWQEGVRCSSTFSKLTAVPEKC